MGPVLLGTWIWPYGTIVDIFRWTADMISSRRSWSWLPLLCLLQGQLQDDLLEVKVEEINQDREDQISFTTLLVGGNKTEKVIEAFSERTFCKRGITSFPTVRWACFGILLSSEDDVWSDLQPQDAMWDILRMGFWYVEEERICSPCHPLVGCILQRRSHGRRMIACLSL